MILGEVKEIQTTPGPEWGVDLILSKSSVNYGPWADRQRRSIQKFFFPQSYRSSQPTPQAKIGDFRTHDNFNLTFKFENDTSVWRVPFREESKDWMFLDETILNEGAKMKSLKNRSYGWLDMKFSSGSYVSLVIPMVSEMDCFSYKMNIKFKNIHVATSLNYSNLLESSELLVRTLKFLQKKLTFLQISLDMNSPLIWNAENFWTFSIKSNDFLKIYYLSQVSLTCFENYKFLIINYKIA